MRYAMVLSLVVIFGLVGCQPAGTGTPDETAAPAAVEPAGSGPQDPPGPIIILQPIGGGTTSDTPVKWYKKKRTGTPTLATYSGSVFDGREGQVCYLRHDLMGIWSDFLKTTTGAGTQSKTNVTITKGNFKINIYWKKNTPLTWVFTKGSDTCYAQSLYLRDYELLVLPTEFDGFQIQHIDSNNGTINVTADIAWISDTQP